MASVLVSPSNVGHIRHMEDVQELSQTQPTSVPERFVRDVNERPVLDSTCSDMPIIDFSKFIIGTTEERQQEILNLAAACEEWGCFQVVNHGVDLELLGRMIEILKEFFMLPSEEKQKYPMIPGTAHGYGRAFVLSEDQKLDWCSMYALGITPYHTRQPQLWPTKPEKFSETLEEYSREVRKLCEKLLGSIALGLGLKEDGFGEIFGEEVQAVRMNYYPPCSRPDLVMGLSPHSDGSAFTVLHQSKGSPVGLHILKDSKWLPTQPLPDALVIITGDTLEVLTNGKYKSLEHRAVANEEKDRISIVTFFAPNYEAELGPMPEFIDENNPSRYRRYIHREYSRHYVNNKLQGKKTLDFTKIQSENSN